MNACKIVLVTGAAGFIGSNLVMELVKTQSPVKIIGIDNMNDYYDVSIKEYRLKQIEECFNEHPESEWIFMKGSIADKTVVESAFLDYKPDIVVNLAAQAGVRYSITNPDAYIESNLIGFYNIWKRVDIVMTMVPEAWSIWYMPHLLRYMVPIKRFHIRQRIR